MKRRKIFVIQAIAIVSVLITGCSSIFDRVTPAEAVEEMVIRHRPDVYNFMVSSKRMTPLGEIFIIYTYQTQPKRDDSISYYLGYASVKRNTWKPWQWQVIANTGSGSNTPPLKGELVDYFISQSDYFFVFGVILSDKVGKIEAVQSDGIVRRDEVTDQFFAIFSQKGAVFCELRVLGKDSELVDDIKIELATSLGINCP